MRYSCIKSVEYDLKQHHELLSRFTDEMQQLSLYEGWVIKPNKIREGKRYYSGRGPGSSGFGYLGDATCEQVIHIRELAFYKAAVKLIRRNILAMEDMLAVYRKTSAENINELLPLTYTLPPDSPLLIDESFVEEWLQMQNHKKNSYPVFDPAGLKVTAFDGTPMRSRAEAIHYAAFYIYDVPAIFELPYEIEGEVYRPDFTILDVFTMTDKMWEHLGFWFHSNEHKRKQYRAEALHRIDEFAKIGYYPEFNLLLSFGTESNVFDLQALLRKVSMFAAPPPTKETMEMLKRL